ncbi:immunoglobulin-like and fibronectin type III domain-containing protein 1 [Eleginops maclovinus]|uniref:immunoglobulin-like and fibronectin type III domain-containing protein 1 n=1 Tax=Eleginops maclovinus TaxID=56733 RepID=UPI0030806997
MWKRESTNGPAPNRRCFSLVHQYIQRFNEVSGSKTAVIRRRSKTPGVIISQYVVNIPEGKSTPDFASTPTPLNIKEGNIAVFKVMAIGDPKPEVSWRRTKGPISDKKTFLSKYDESTGEHILEILKVSGEESDTYKCYASNEYGKAVCSTTLNLVDDLKNPSDFRKMLRKSKVDEKGDGESDERFWNAMLKADRNDYERICNEFGVTDIHLVLKKLKERKERVQNKCKDGMIPYNEDATEKHSLKDTERPNGFNVKSPMEKGSGLQQGNGQVYLPDTGLSLVDGQVKLSDTELSVVDGQDKLSDTRLSVVDGQVKLSDTGLSVVDGQVKLSNTGLSVVDGQVKLSNTGLSVVDGQVKLFNTGLSVVDGQVKLSDTGLSLVDGRVYLHDTALSNVDGGVYFPQTKNHLVDGDIKPPHTGLNLVDEGVKLLYSEFKLSNVDFVVKIQELKAQEREDALFACVLTHPLPRISWMGKGSALQDGEKYNITVSDHKLIHRLLIRDCTQQDSGIYSAVAGITSCSAWLVVQVEGDPSSAERAGKTTLAGGAQIDLEKVARERQIKNREEMEKILAAVKAKQGEGALKERMTLTTGRDGEITTVNGLGQNNGAGTEEQNATTTNALSEPTEKGHKGKVKKKESRGDTAETKCDASGCETQEGPQMIDGPKTKKHRRSGQADFDKMKIKTRSGSVRRTKSKKKVPRKASDQDQNGLENDDTTTENEASGDDDGESNDSESYYSGSYDSGSYDSESDNARSGNAESNEGSAGQLKNSRRSKRSKRQKKSINGKKILDGGLNTCPEDHNDSEETEGGYGTAKRSRRKRKGPLIEDMVIDPGVHFICGLSDVTAIINETAELTCKLSSEDCEGAWFRDGKKIFPDENFNVIKDGAIHKLIIIRCEEEHTGKYRFEADHRKTEAMINVKDPPRFDPEDLGAFTEPVTVKVGHNAIFKLQFVGHEPIKIKWYKEGEELLDDNNTKIEKSASHSRLLLSRCQRKDTGEIKIKLKNEHGFIEAISQLIVLYKPTSPLGPAEVTESSAKCIEFKWRPPKDDGGSPVTNYIIERQQVGRNTWKKLGEIPGVSSYRDTDVDHGRKYFYRIRAVTAEGTSEVMETDEMQAGTLAFPGPPAPPKVVSAFDDCINISWAAPIKTGGSRILGYILERRKKGSNLWTVVNAMDELIKEKKYAVKDVVVGMEYEFRVSAINISGIGEFSNASEFVFARDPKKPPGKVIGLKVTETSYTHFVLTWTKPEDKPGVQDEAKGYFVEIRPADCIEWSRCNTTFIITTSFSVKGLRHKEIYWVRVIAFNDGGNGAAEEMPNYVLAMPSPVRPKFTNHKMKSFLVVKAGNSVRITVHFEASPRPHITWVKDNVPVSKRVTISNSDGSSQLLIPSSERSDSGIYSILVKNLVGQETFSTEVRVTDDPKPPGPVELDENVPGTVTVMWEPSPDEKRDDRLHYTVSKLDSTKRTWTIVADRLFNNRFTVCNIMHGREYHFRVYAKNDMGISAPSESPTCGREKKKEKFKVNIPTIKDCDLRCAPTFIVPLKFHTAPKGYECYMSCAVKGNPPPRITWYRNHISLNTNTNYYISNTCGVCSLLILRVGPKDMGEYTISAENALGRAECSTTLSVRE